MARQSGRETFEATVLPHLDAAFNLARWLMRSRGDAEDVVQEAMLRALTYFPGFRGANPRGWLLQIVRNAAYASLKLNRGPASVPIDDAENAAAELADPHDDPEASLIKERDRRRIGVLLDGLPVDLREAVVLRELEELSYKEIAQVTEVPIGTVMSRLWRARHLLAASVRAQDCGR